MYEGEGWVAVGFSDSGAMVPADAVIGLPDIGTALEYDLSDYVRETNSAARCFELSRAV